jgi:hypothetical protein
MAKIPRTILGAATVATLVALLAGCGGSSTPPTPVTPPPTIQGIATPPSVAVVTATNAG